MNYNPAAVILASLSYSLPSKYLTHVGLCNFLSLSHQDHRVPESRCFFCSSLIPLQWTGAWHGINTSKYLLHKRTDVHFPWSVECQ